MSGSLHPLTIFLRQAIAVFRDMGFEVLEGPEIESEWYNFDSLRVPEWHPARDVQDTFYLEDGRLLRTHTSAMQVRAMEKRKPPVRIIVPGRVFRNEATDASHEANFYQLEGFAIDSHIQMRHLFGVLEKFVREIFGSKTKYRFVPAYFPFVEPGTEMLIQLGKQKKWLEVLGAGMIHPEVLKNMGVDPNKFQGFAFGMGVDRLAMILAGFNDVRLSYQGDLRFLKQFKFKKC
ncbi:phenylalanine--tRNA ligase subunit alpha [bacterium]|nr:phenylalanine--tRNA ligase subunit alpha [bacterium]